MPAQLRGRKRHRYRYYLCWTRNRYGPGACDAERLRADELEDGVMAALVELYGDPDMIREAIGASATDAERVTQRTEQEIAALDPELRRTEAAIERYMLAFENGKLAEDMFAVRVEDLAAGASTLRSRRADAAATVAATATGASVPSVAEVAELHAELRSVAESAPDELRKAVTQAFVHELLVEERCRILSTFRALCVILDPSNGACSDVGPVAMGVCAMIPVFALCWN